MANLLADTGDAPVAAPTLEAPITGTPEGAGGDSDALVDKAVLASMDIFFHPESIGSADEALQAGDPALAAGDLAASLVTQVDEKSGGEMPEDIILPTGFSVLREIMDYSIEKGLHDFSADDEQAAISSMIQKLMVAYGSTEEQYQEFAQAEGQGSAADVQALTASLTDRGV